MQITITVTTTEELINLAETLVRMAPLKNDTPQAKPVSKDTPVVKLTEKPKKKPGRKKRMAV